MILRALIEVWPDEVSAFVHELPGVIATAPSMSLMLELLPDAIEEHLSWMAAHGFDVRSNAGVEVEISEELPAIDGRFGPLFHADREEATAAQVEVALSVAALARRDLVDVYRSTSQYRRDRLADAGGWTLGDHLRHVAEAEVFYTSRLIEGDRIPLSQDPVAAIQESARYAHAILSDLPDSARDQVFERGNEQWTATKVLRRMTGHLREHYPWMRELSRG